MSVKESQTIPTNNTGRLFFLLAKLSKQNNSQEGMTLLECLIAIVVVAVVITVFTPPMFLAVATRVQNRRAEQAIQLAQGEIDKVRRTVELGSYTNAQLPPVGNSNVQQQSAPTSAQRPLRPDNPSYVPFPPSASTGYLIDVNGDNTDDFVVQTYRTPAIERDNRAVAFRVGVRIYSVVVNQNFGALENPPQRNASLGLTTALGSQRRRPLATMYTNVNQSDNRNSLCSLQQFLNNAPNDNNQPACQ